MNKKRIIPILLFILALIVIDRLLGIGIQYFAQKHKYDQRMVAVLNHDIKTDMVILGSSRALNNYGPAIITQITGKSCYNLGFSGSNVVFHETMLDLLLMQEHKPKVIIYNVDDCATLFNVDGIEFRKDVLLPYIDHPFINAQVCKSLDKAEWATWISASYRHNVNFIKALKYIVYGKENMDYKTSNIDSTGANLLVQRPEDPVPTFLKDKKLVKSDLPDTSYINAFIRIQQKCADNGIQLVLFLPPLYTTPTAGFAEQIKHVTNGTLPIFDHTTAFSDSTLFFNPDHLNKKGAILYSQQVGKDLQSILH